MNYKHSGSKDWYYFIDDFGNKTEFNEKNKPLMYAEMLEWEAEGNTIEAQFTEEELEQKATKDLEQAMKDQHNEIIRRLDKSEIHVGNHPRHPNDVSKWEASRVIWWGQLDETELVEIEPLPFS